MITYFSEIYLCVIQGTMYKDSKVISFLVNNSIIITNQGQS